MARARPPSPLIQSRPRSRRGHCEWIWRRLEKSRQYLADPLHSGASIAQIALSCGFADFGHYNRRYKRPSLRRFTT
jgi:AraC-like DNA-binding protein